MSTRISASLVVNANAEIACMTCGHAFGPSGKPWKDAASFSETTLKGAGGEPYTNATNVLLRRFYCPGCAVLLDSETALAGDPFLNDVVHI
jgi:acetone carboxylase gamma subunit